MQLSNALTIGRGSFSVVVAMLIAVHSSGCSAADEPSTQPAARTGAFAVVELFTSEGCSSCPPADDLLGDIADDAQHRGVNIYPIAFHIDYWDSLGWKDRFSLAASTDRQQHYANVLQSQVYTPQMVVNGQTQFVGSDRDAYRRAVGDVLATQPTTHLKLELGKAAGAEISIKYATPDAPAGCVLNLVVVQRSATTDVPRGENAGHTLHHVNIARSIKTISLDGGTGEATVKLPADIDPKDSFIIGYVQIRQTLRIVAASQVDAVASKPSP